MENKAPLSRMFINDKLNLLQHDRKNLRFTAEILFAVFPLKQPF